MANDLYTLIQNKQADIDSISSGLAAKQKAAPTVEASLREATMGNDAGLNSLRQGYSDGMLELFKYDQEKAKSYLSPEMQAAGMVANPMVGESSQQGKFMATAKANQGMWQELDKRKTVLGDVVKSSMALYNAQLEGDKTLLDTAEKGLARALQEYQYERTESRLQKGQDLQYEVGETGIPQDIQDSVQMIIDGTGSIKDIPIAKRAAVSNALKKQGFSGVNLISAADRKPVALSLELNKASKDAQKLYKESFTGPVDVTKGNLNVFFNKGDDDFVKYGQMVAGVKTAIQNAIAGANLTKQEIEELKDFVIRPLDSDQQVKNKLQGLQDWSKRKGQSLLTTGSYGMTFDSLLGDLETDLGKNFPGGSNEKMSLEDLAKKYGL